MEVTPLEGIFFDDRKNDIACKIRDNFLFLIEHQSSVNPNMPFRCLSYVVELMNELVKISVNFIVKNSFTFRHQSFLSSMTVMTTNLWRKQWSYRKHYDDDCLLELIVTALNINFVLNPSILKKYPYLNDYSTLVNKIKPGIISVLSRRNSIIRAVNSCIDEGIMKEYLKTRAEELFTMLALECEIQAVEPSEQCIFVGHNLQKKFLSPTLCSVYVNYSAKLILFKFSWNLNLVYKAIKIF